MPPPMIEIRRGFGAEGDDKRGAVMVQIMDAMVECYNDGNWR